MKVVLDWDGTVTDEDVLYEVVRTFGDEGVYGETEERLGRELTLNEVIAIEVATVRTPLHEVEAWVRDNVRLRAGFAEFADTFDLLIVSSGFHELIEPVLAREGLRLPVVANRLDPRADGWRSIFRNADSCEMCGEPCKRSDVAGLDGFVYVGDGVSDRCVSLVASRVFARAGLARYLAARGAPFEPFEDFDDISSAL